MKFKILNGILIVDILCVLLILSIVFIPSTIIRVILGLPFLLFFPGYTLTAILFIKNEGIDNIERAAISLGMSIAVAALIGLGLNYTPWGIRLESVLFSITAFIVLTSAIALIRRARILKTNIFITEVTLSLPSWGDDIFNKILSIILIIVIFAAFGVLGYTLAVPQIGERFSEFYILGINGKAQDFPNEYIMNNGQIIKVIYSQGTVDVISGFGALTLGIVNHERQATIYYVKMTIDYEPMQINSGGSFTDILGPIELQHGEKWESAVNIVPRYIKDNQKVEFLLFKETETAPINSSHLWISVKSAKSDATLSNLTISSGTLIPAFSLVINNYTANVNNTVSSVTITPMVRTTPATVTVNDNPVATGSPSEDISLDVGDNIITIVVTAEDATTKIYAVTVTRAPPTSNDATLSNLIIDTGTLTPAFTSDTTNYTANVGNWVNYIHTRPITNESHATITVNDNPVPSGWYSQAISLNVGENIVTIVVTAEDTTTTLTYTITVTREELQP